MQTADKTEFSLSNSRSPTEIQVQLPNGKFAIIRLLPRMMHQVVNFSDEDGTKYQLPSFCVFEVALTENNRKFYSKFDLGRLYVNRSQVSDNTFTIKDKCLNDIKIKLESDGADVWMLWPENSVQFFEKRLLINV